MLFLFSLLSIGLCDYLPTDPLEGGSSCLSYSCAASSKSRPATDSCMWLNTTSTSSYYLWPCASGMNCNVTSGKCEKEVTEAATSYIGSACSSLLPCVTGSCTSGICRGYAINQKCSSHDQCDSGLRCLSSNSTCQPQLNVGESGCRSYLDCVNWATCNVTGSKGNCVEYGSAALGSTVNDCINGFSYMCVLGSCARTGYFSNVGTCNYPPVSNSVNPKTCDADSDCQGSQNGQIITSKCLCGKNSWGNKYCSLFLGDLPGQNMIKTWNKALKFSGKCNTVHRSSDECMKSVGLFKNTSQATLLYYNYPLYQFNDDCVKINLNDEYWFEAAQSLYLGIVFMMVFS